MNSTGRAWGLPPQVADKLIAIESTSDSARNQGFEASKRPGEGGDRPAAVDDSESTSDSARNQGFEVPDVHEIERSIIRVTEFYERASDSARNGGGWHVVEPYPSHGLTYYRYRWGKKHAILGCLHVPGGNQQNPVVQSRAIALR